MLLKVLQTRSKGEKKRKMLLTFLWAGSKKRKMSKKSKKRKGDYT